ncbi:uncharacterized protein LOC124370433 [Homalodisca vitripennis]|uniref:uncharacterized protein LOC124370433 n=1 Tax=Homalodisca vitripennis TaxID=197043 RepID=UPI001EECC4CB|nr:uncharacterized protein LOC124370433 [Homalodisca vitripennis]KAG8299871.1 hypothetical protein J6590_090523 [Homalodisca vitripennis]
MQFNTGETQSKATKKSKGNQSTRKRKATSRNTKYIDKDNDTEMKTQDVIIVNENVKSECQSVFQFIDVNSIPKKGGKKAVKRKKNENQEKLTNIEVEHAKNDSASTYNILDELLHSKQQELFSSLGSIDLIQNLADG